MERFKLNVKDDIFFTRSMAEVLERQGCMEDALAIYKILSDSSPEDPSLREKVKSLKEIAWKRSVFNKKR
ncbi:MAG: hypothetical protein HY883_00565 [Deltaproteobacteria bacterium]|nr:hypothetical protein [Deltaproteobacteria bacterium]